MSWFVGNFFFLVKSRKKSCVYSKRWIKIWEWGGGRYLINNIVFFLVSFKEKEGVEGDGVDFRRVFEV